MFKTMAFVFLCSAQLGPLYGAENERMIFPSADLSGLYVATETGAITVDGVPKGDVLIEIADNEPEKCRLTAAVEGGKIVLKAEGKPAPATLGWKNFLSFFNKRKEMHNCRAGFKVSAPAALNLDAVSGTGDIHLSKLSGSIDVNSGTGGLTGEVCAGQLNVKSGTGAVKLKGLCGLARVKSGTGAVTLHWAKAPASGEVLVETGTSDISLVFPRGAGFTAALVSGTGSINNEFKAGGGFTVSAKSGTGGISVKKDQD